MMRKLGRILLLIGKWGLKFITHLLRRLVIITYNILLGLFVIITYYVTYEPNTRGRVTLRKIRRIRVLTKVKLYMWKYGSWFFKWTNNKYIESVYKTFSYQIEKKDK
jgi:hypothetical protein